MSVTSPTKFLFATCVFHGCMSPLIFLVWETKAGHSYTPYKMYERVVKIIKASGAKVGAFFCDAPERKALRGMQGIACTHPCDYCEVRGIYKLRC